MRKPAIGSLEWMNTVESRLGNHGQQLDLFHKLGTNEAEWLNLLSSRTRLLSRWLFLLSLALASFCVITCDFPHQCQRSEVSE